MCVALRSDKSYERLTRKNSVGLCAISGGALETPVGAMRSADRSAVINHVSNLSSTIINRGSAVCVTAIDHSSTLCPAAISCGRKKWTFFFLSPLAWRFRWGGPPVVSQTEPNNVIPMDLGPPNLPPPPSHAAKKRIPEGGGGVSERKLNLPKSWDLPPFSVTVKPRDPVCFWKRH